MADQYRNVCVTLLALVAIVALVGTLLLFSGSLTGAQVAVEQFCRVSPDCPKGYMCQRLTSQPHAVLGKCLPLT